VAILVSARFGLSPSQHWKTTVHILPLAALLDQLPVAALELHFHSAFYYHGMLLRRCGKLISPWLDDANGGASRLGMYLEPSHLAVEISEMLASGAAAPHQAGQLLRSFLSIANFCVFYSYETRFYTL